VDPDSLIPDSNTDPDPAFQVNPDPDQVRIQGFDDQKLKKIKTAENCFLSFFDNYVLATGEASSRQKITSSTSNIIFMIFFLCLWVVFALLDPDTDPRNPLNPDPQHCFLSFSF
jgi:hypothetical protein